ncbi:MAG: hypothetical protein QOH96_272 [Blastocatellia bacterium]|jgi:hypothetical protein|nr:hypothetical protein [Blastocatellia bacterium]
MSQTTSDQRTGPRYLASFLVKAEWDDESGHHFIAEGTTENVGPEGALIHLQRNLPSVGCRVNLQVLGDHGEKLNVVTEVLRLERNAAHPLAALQLIDAQNEWRGIVWEAAATQVRQQSSETYVDDDFSH